MAVLAVTARSVSALSVSPRMSVPTTKATPITVASAAIASRAR
ncbi:hypothetical protein ACFQXA_32345 [Nocardiopsis composta]